jgi:methyl-accepting chemotaxis protein
MEEEKLTELSIKRNDELVAQLQANVQDTDAQTC